MTKEEIFVNPLIEMTSKDTKVSNVETIMFLCLKLFRHDHFSILAQSSKENHFIHYEHDVALIKLKKAFDDMSPICLTKKLTENVLNSAQLFSPGILH